MALLLAAPANRIFLVGDDDQSIYGWRLADVRRLLGLAETSLPGLRRVDLVTNYRCPAAVVRRAVRLVEGNRERFAKRIAARPDAPGEVILAPTAADDADRCLAVLRSWPDPSDDAPDTRAILARTNRELLPAVVAAIADDVPFRAAGLELPVDSPLVDELLARRGAIAGRRATRRGPGGGPGPGNRGRPDRSPRPSWHGRPRFATLAALEAAVADVRARLARLRRDDATPDPRHRPRDEGPRVRSRGRHRHGRGPLPERPLGRRGRGSRPRPRGGAAPRLRGLDPRAAIA